MKVADKGNAKLSPNTVKPELGAHIMKLVEDWLTQQAANFKNELPDKVRGRCQLVQEEY